MMRRVLRVAVVLLLTVAALVGLAGSASAVTSGIPKPPDILRPPEVLKPPCRVSPEPGCSDEGADLINNRIAESCKDAPTPAMPGRGLTGYFVRPPEKLPPDADPFAKDATVSIYQVYGYAGLTWNTYDLGCGPDLARDPGASVGTTMANWVSQMPQSWTAMTGALVGEAYEPSFLGVLDPLVDRVVKSLQVSVFEKYAWLVMAAFGLMLILASRKQRMSTSAGAIAWAMLVMILVTSVFRWPTMAGHAADESMSSVLTSVNSGLNGGDSEPAGDVLTGHLHKSLLYDTWLAGTFGSATSATATKYGPAIFASSALTWREAAVLQSDPAKGKAIIEAKQQKFKETAEAIKSADPDSYEYLTGKRSDTRVGYAFLSLAGALLTIPFLVIAGILVLAALVIIRFGVMMFPAFATLGLFPTMRSLVIGLGSTMAAALINAAVFGGAVSVMVLALGVVMTSGSPGWLTVLIMLILTIVFWFGLKPFRNLTRMVSASDMSSAAAEAIAGPARAARAVGELGLKAGAAIATSGAGVAAGSLAADHIRAQAAPQRAEGQSDQVHITTQVVSRDPEPEKAEVQRALPAPERPALSSAPRAGIREQGAPEDPAPTRAQPMSPGPRPGDDGSAVEGVVLPIARFETENA